MSKDFWKHIKYFTPEEVGAEDIDSILMFKLDLFRSLLDRWVIVHCGYETSGHSPNSYHYQKKAVDFHVRDHFDYKLQFRFLMQVGFNGIGWYPEWNNPGWHVDTRDGFTLWTQRNGKYVYFI